GHLRRMRWRKKQSWASTPRLSGGFNKMQRLRPSHKRLSYINDSKRRCVSLFMRAEWLQNLASPCSYPVPLPIDPTRSTLPPVAQFLAEAALQRQTALLGLDKQKPVAAPAPLPVADPSAPPPSVNAPSPPAGPLPTPADEASFSPQARAQLAAGFDPRRGGVADGRLPGSRGDGALPGVPPAPRTSTGASAATAASGAAWP